MSQSTMLLKEFQRRGSIYNYELVQDYHILQYNARIYDVKHKLGEDITCEPDPQHRNGVNLFVYHPKQPVQEPLLVVERGRNYDYD